MDRLPDDIIDPRFFPPALFATCTQFRKKIPVSARDWLRNCNIGPLPTGDLAREGDRARLTLIRAFRDNWLTSYGPPGAFAAADWILSFGRGACGAAIEVAPRKGNWRARMLELGAQPYPNNRFMVHVDKHPRDHTLNGTGSIVGIWGLEVLVQLTSPSFEIITVRTDEVRNTSMLRVSRQPASRDLEQFVYQSISTSPLF